MTKETASLVPFAGRLAGSDWGLLNASDVYAAGPRYNPAACSTDRPAAVCAKLSASASTATIATAMLALTVVG